MGGGVTPLEVGGEVSIGRYAGGPGAPTTPALAGLLVDAVAGGASVGFVAPLASDEAEDWWRAALADETTVTLVARVQDQLVGCVRLHLAPQANGAHRAEIGKLLVHSAARRRGIASALLAAAEDEARALGRSVLVLDTETGSDAERLYRRHEWREVGVINDYAAGVDGTLAATTIFTKRLS